MINSQGTGTTLMLHAMDLRLANARLFIPVWISTTRSNSTAVSLAASRV